MTTNVLNCLYRLDTRVKVKRISYYTVLNESAIFAMASEIPGSQITTCHIDTSGKHCVNSECKIVCIRYQQTVLVCIELNDVHRCT